MPPFARRWHYPEFAQLTSAGFNHVFAAVREALRTLELDALVAHAESNAA